MYSVSRLPLSIHPQVACMLATNIPDQPTPVCKSDRDFRAGRDLIVSSFHCSGSHARLGHVTPVGLPSRFQDRLCSTPSFSTFLYLLKSFSSPQILLNSTSPPPHCRFSFLIPLDILPGYSSSATYTYTLQIHRLLLSFHLCFHNGLPYYSVWVAGL